MKIDLARSIGAVKNSARKIFSRAVFHLRRGMARAGLDIKTKRGRGILVLIIAGAVFWQWGLNAALLWSLFLAFLFYGWENRVIGVFALLALASCPALIAIARDDLAETMAVYAYWFLAMTVALQIAEYRKSK